jgi:hypothetical protein
MLEHKKSVIYATAGAGQHGGRRTRNLNVPDACKGGNQR